MPWKKHKKWPFAVTWRLGSFTFSKTEIFIENGDSDSFVPGNNLGI